MMMADSALHENYLSNNSINNNKSKMKKQTFETNGKIRIGTVLIHMISNHPHIIANSGIHKTTYGASYLQLINLTSGIMYAKACLVMNANDITEDEFDRLCGGDASSFYIAKNEDVELHYAELSDIQRRTNPALIDEILEKQKHNPANAHRTADAIKNVLNKSESFSEFLQKQMASAFGIPEHLLGSENDDREKFGIWHVFGITKERYDVIQHECKRKFKHAEDKFNNETFASLRKGNTNDVIVMDIAPIIDFCREYCNAMEFACMMFVIGQRYFNHRQSVKNMVNIINTIPGFDKMASS